MGEASYIMELIYITNCIFKVYRKRIIVGAYIIHTYTINTDDLIFIYDVFLENIYIIKKHYINYEVCFEKICFLKKYHIDYDVFLENKF